MVLSQYVPCEDNGPPITMAKNKQTKGRVGRILDFVYHIVIKKEQQNF